MNDNKSFTHNYDNTAVNAAVLNHVNSLSLLLSIILIGIIVIITRFPG